MVRFAVGLFAIALGCTDGDDIPSPKITTISPDHAQPGITVTIVGDFFCQQPDEEVDPFDCENVGSVEFGQVPATVGMYTDELITAEVPPLGAGRFGVAVAVHARRSNAIEFTVESP